MSGETPKTSQDLTVLRISGGIPEPILRGLVALHRTELSGGFLTSLGNRPLEFLFSAAALVGPGFLYIATDDANKVCGFLLGATGTRNFYRHFLSHYGLKTLAAIWWRLISFKAVYKVCETLLYPAKRPKGSLPEAELLDLVVSSELAGKGVGRKLFSAFAAGLQENGILRFVIPTSESLVGAHKFYERMGATLVANVVVHKGESTRLYVYNIS